MIRVLSVSHLTKLIKFNFIQVANFCQKLIDTPEHLQFEWNTGNLYHFGLDLRHYKVLAYFRLCRVTLKRFQWNLNNQITEHVHSRGEWIAADNSIVLNGVNWLWENWWILVYSFWGHLRRSAKSAATNLWWRKLTYCFERFRLNQKVPYDNQNFNSSEHNSYSCDLVSTLVNWVNSVQYNNI